jgi:hypothetical protein
MAETLTQPNNVKIEFRGKAARDMPMESQAQAAAMHAAAEGRSTIGIPKSVGKKFVKDSHGQSVKKLPKRVRQAHKRGLISDRQMAKMRGGG